MKNDSLVFSLGGHLLSGESAPRDFLKKIKAVIERNIGRRRFYFVVGGGDIAREYQAMARDNGVKNSLDLDNIGIAATRLNAEIFRAVFAYKANKNIFFSPREALRMKSKIGIGGGWKSGFSTDYVAVQVAKLVQCQTIVNLSKIDFICDKDPSLYKDARPLPKLNWQDLRRLVGNKWSPGLNMPFDPLACAAAEKGKMALVFINGFNYVNLANYLQGKKFSGSVIS